MNSTDKGKTVGQVKYFNPVEIIWDCVTGGKSNAYAGCCISGCNRNTGQAQGTFLFFLGIFTGGPPACIAYRVIWGIIGPCNRIGEDKAPATVVPRLAEAIKPSTGSSTAFSFVRGDSNETLPAFPYSHFLVRGLVRC